MKPDFLYFVWSIRHYFTYLKEFHIPLKAYFIEVYLLNKVIIFWNLVQAVLIYLSNKLLPAPILHTSGDSDSHTPPSALALPADVSEAPPSQAAQSAERK